MTDNIVRHSSVNLTRNLDKARIEVEFTGLPGQVVGIKRDAVPSDSGAGIKGHESKGLGLRRIDDLPDIDSHGGVDTLELVHEGDVDEAENILRELDCLGSVATADGDDFADGT